MNELFSIAGKVAVITGAGGVLGGSIARHFLTQGAKIAALDIRQEPLDKRVAELRALGGDITGIVSNTLDIKSLQQAADNVATRWGQVDILLNIAGGNLPGATLGEEQPFHEMKTEDWENVTTLNLNGTVYPCMIFGKMMATRRRGAIINLSSMAAYAALTRVPGYSAAKTGVSNFTQWLATEMALKYGDGIRVNAIAPGFFIGDQNRSILLNPDGSLSERSLKIIAKTPMKRFGNVAELHGAIQFLASDAAPFITGAILPVDGGFSAFSGV
jgi:NAD(P)-dependent dehydrogenase (short-subunit alcohol dehydrogenase family)